MEWISVETDFPDLFVPVLCQLETGEVKVMIYEPTIVGSQCCWGDPSDSFVIKDDGGVEVSEAMFDVSKPDVIKWASFDVPKMKE